jgi:hypothetical protein
VKRPHKNDAFKPDRTGDIKKDLSLKQLAGIGAVALAYNEVERNIDGLFFTVTRLSGELQYEVSTRINGIDGKIEIINKGAKSLGLDEQDLWQLAEALGQGVFGKLKSYRDAVIHARLINASVGIGTVVGKRAKMSDVLLSESALNCIYSHLIALRDELSRAVTLLGITRTLAGVSSNHPSKESLQEGKIRWSPRFRACQVTRSALPPIPEFPSESELREAEIQWEQTLQAETMGWFSPLNQPQPINAANHPSFAGNLTEPPAEPKK